MRLLGRTQCLVVLFSVFSACVYGLKIDFSRLAKPYKRTDLSCTDCGSAPAAPTNGGVTGVTGDDYLATCTVTYSCDTGFVMTGSETATCLADGTWDYTATECIADSNDDSEDDDTASDSATCGSSGSNNDKKVKKDKRFKNSK